MLAQIEEKGEGFNLRDCSAELMQQKLDAMLQEISHEDCQRNVTSRAVNKATHVRLCHKWCRLL
jgi:hypothetical protein